MIRYATVDDADWIVALQEANTDLNINVQRGDKLISEIESNKYIISDDDETGEPKSFIYFEPREDAVRIFLTLTEGDSRQLGHARLLYMYLYAKYNLPLHYRVEAGSESEQIWAKRSEAVQNKTTLIHSIHHKRDGEAVVYNEYLARYE